MMKQAIFLVACLGLVLMAPHDVQAKSKGEIRAESQALVQSHKREAVLIYNWLKHTPEISIHQMRGATQNVVYVMPPGNREAVYDGAGKLVQDGMNDGSYNHYPYDQPLNHFMYDILPWHLWGASKKDPSSQGERLSAYVDDLRRGLNGARKHPSEPVDLNKLQPHETVVLATFINAIEQGGAGKVYDYLANPGSELSAADWTALASQLETGLAKQLAKPKDIGALTPSLPSRR